jgi:signal transduction histidine kinase
VLGGHCRSDRQHLLHVAREALSNTIRHARARSARVSVEETVAAVRMEIADDGVGFDTSTASAGGRGLQNMASRARQIGATFDIHSAPGHGTRVTLAVPGPATEPTSNE